ncbi:hypothetical protein GCM10027346_16110 [Hymenobacter seoulensis]
MRHIAMSNMRWVCKYKNVSHVSNTGGVTDTKHTSRYTQFSVTIIHFTQDTHNYIIHIVSRNL